MNRDGNEVFLTESGHYITDHTRKLLGAVAFPSESIAFAKVGAAVFLDRKRILAQPSCLDNNMAAFVLTEEQVDISFVYFLLLTIRFSAFANTTALPALSGTVLSRIRMSLPPLPEQRAIAAVLSDVDELIGSLEALIAKKRAIKKAAMQELLTGRIRLPGFRGQWETRRLGDLGEISGAGVDKKTRPNETPVRLLNYLDVYHKTFIRSHYLTQTVSAADRQVLRCRISQGDVFFTPTSEVPNDIGKSALAMEDIVDGVYSYHVVRFRLYVDWDLRFRAFAFDTEAFRAQTSRMAEGSGTRYVITLPKFRSLIVSYPPTVAEQRAIATVLADMDFEIAGLEQRLDKTRAIKQGMMQQLLTGSIRLPIPDIDTETDDAHDA